MGLGVWLGLGLCKHSITEIETDTRTDEMATVPNGIVQCGMEVFIRHWAMPLDTVAI